MIYTSMHAAYLPCEAKMEIRHDSIAIVIVIAATDYLWTRRGLLLLWFVWRLLLRDWEALRLSWLGLCCATYILLAL